MYAARPLTKLVLSRRQMSGNESVQAAETNEGDLSTFNELPEDALQQ